MKMGGEGYGRFYKTAYIDGGRFYFPRPSVKWIDEIEKRAYRFHFLGDSLPDGEKRDLVEYFTQLPQEAEMKLRRYLQIG